MRANTENLMRKRVFLHSVKAPASFLYLWRREHEPPRSGRGWWAAAMRGAVAPSATCPKPRTEAGAPPVLRLPGTPPTPTLTHQASPRGGGAVRTPASLRSTKWRAAPRAEGRGTSTRRGRLWSTEGGRARAHAHFLVLTVTGWPPRTCPCRKQTLQYRGWQGTRWHLTPKGPGGGGS